MEENNFQEVFTRQINNANVATAKVVEQEAFIQDQVVDEGGAGGNGGEDGDATIEAGESQEGAALDDSIVNLEDLLGDSDEELF